MGASDAKSTLDQLLTMRGGGGTAKAKVGGEGGAGEGHADLVT